MKKRQKHFISDADQIRIWKAALVFSDGRMSWPKALRKAIQIIERQADEIQYLMDSQP